MKQYIFAFLKNGETKISDTAARREIIMAHLANIKRLSDEGKLILAGPFLDDAGLAGIFIFNVATMEEAKQLVNTDPGVKAGIFAIELHPWYGSASLLEIPKLHRAVQKKSFED